MEEINLSVKDENLTSYLLVPHQVCLLTCLSIGNNIIEGHSIEEFTHPDFIVDGDDDNANNIRYSIIRHIIISCMYV